ncbi:Fdx7 [Desulfamplus magnetovallimortis]|uniref:Fdx7 n=1 Tax=Desulfamplus magnetovallimortis TaxID=1246637 RepID=A0A1W1H540_9BACT|nr:ASKHA domain-containing protein [Desulfamplus magnetovallimortis]SLM27591.1 Fdx7 [Desulfamplus magnetovallimortis]
MSGKINNSQSYVKYIEVPVPVLGNNIADVERLKAPLLKELKGVDNIFVPTGLAVNLPSKLRKWGNRIKVVLFRDSRGWFVVDLLEPDPDKPLFGLAVDLGTTRIVLRLVNLEISTNISSASCHETAFDNPQVKVAPDVLARIHHAGTEKGRSELQDLVIEGLSNNINILCRKQGVEPKQVVLLTVAGNSAMTHLFLGIESSFLIREPYIPAVNAPEPVTASELGIGINPRGMVYMFPNIGSYFGGDLISGILFAGLNKKENPCIMVDVGTNAEVVVGNRDWLIACAGAAGPALEGGVSDMGMTAKPGVIDTVKIDRETGKVDIHTIDEKSPIGICGSGMIDLAAQLFLSGMVDIRGKFVPSVCGSRYIEVGGEGENRGAFCLVKASESGTGKDILLTQIDMNSLTSSKAAMYSILQVIVEKTAGLEFSELAKFYVAGTFGSFIKPVSAISIGMLPDIPLDRFEVLGNSSLEGASRLLMDPNAFDEIEKIRHGITYIELNVNQEFMNIFSGSKFYPHTDISRFPSVISKC